MLAQLRTLTCFTDIESILPITTGLSSRCYQVNADNKLFFAKKSTTNETKVALLAAEKAFSPKVIFDQQHWLISPFIAGTNLAQSACCIDEKINIAIKLMTQCHQLTATAIKLAPQAIVQGLISQKHFSSEQQDELNQVADSLVSKLTWPSQSSARLVCCHGDLNFSNVLMDQQHCAWLVDYECACIAPIEYDLAMFIAVNHLPTANIPAIVAQYQKHLPVDIELPLLNRYLMFCYWINGLWYFNAAQSCLHQERDKEKLKSLAKQQWSYLPENMTTANKIVALLNLRTG